MGMREGLVRVAGWTQRVQLLVAAAALVILMLVTVLDVFMRYVFNRPVRASLDSVEVLLMVFVFNGMAAAFFGRRHVVIDLLDGVFGPRGTAIMIRIADVLSVLCVGLLIWAMLLPASQAYQYGDTKMELPIPIYALYVVAIISFAGTLFCAVAVLAAGPSLARRGHAE